MRISQENVHSRRPQGHQSTSPQGTQTPYRLTYPKKLRIRKRSHYLGVSKEKRRYVGKVLIVHFRQSKSPKLGITASRKFGKAVVRNQFKRHVREAFRLRQYTVPSYEFIVSPKRGITHASYEMINRDLETFYAQSAARKGS